MMINAPWLYLQAFPPVSDQFDRVGWISSPFGKSPAESTGDHVAHMGGTTPFFPTMT